MRKTALIAALSVGMLFTGATAAQAADNGVESLEYSDGAWTITLSEAQASEVKLIDPAPQEIIYGANYGNTCTDTSYTFVSQAECVMVQVDWTNNVHNSSDPTACREVIPPVEEPPVVVEPPFEAKEVCAFWSVDNYPNNDDDWPQTILSKDCNYAPVAECETYRIQQDYYWIRDEADQAYFDALIVLNSPADDAQLEPHNYSVYNIEAKDCTVPPVEPPVTPPVEPPVVPETPVVTPVTSSTPEPSAPVPAPQEDVLAETGVSTVDVIGGASLLVAVGGLLWYGGSRIKRKGFTNE